jgi:hypothetical protein
MSSRIVNIPNANTLINSMRSIGYDFESAVSDIIDNSISADSTYIDIHFPVHDREDKYIEFVDNGRGMDRNELIEAMKFGSTKNGDRLESDLGRFGLGLKTASISQCKKFTVVSKKNNEIYGFCWDLDILSISSSWEMCELSFDEISNSIPNLNNYNSEPSFTIVLWEKFDTIYKDISLLNSFSDIFSNLISKAEQHISLVFHRYIDDGFIIRVNGNRLVAFDPFLMKHPKTTIKSEQEINTKSSSEKDVKVKIQVVILPYFKDFSKNDYEKIGGHESIDNQGFYIYRNKRLMMFGTWFRIKPKSELSRNARIRVDIPNTLDDLWGIDVKKQKAIIPGALFEQLKAEVSDAIYKSKQIYDYKGHAQTKNGSIWNKIVDERSKAVSYEINQQSSMIKDLIDQLDDNSAKSLNKILKLIQLSLPYKDIYNSVSEKKDINSLTTEDEDLVLNHALSLFSSFKKNKNLSDKDIIRLICSYEPFLSANIQLKLWEKTNG